MRLTRRLLPACLLYLFATGAAATEPVPVTAEAIADGLWMLQGRGGNVAVLAGADGTLIVDDQYAEQTAPLLAALEALSVPAPHWVVNTHWHSDHTGSNAAMHELGANIVAHDNVRRRLSHDQVIAFFNAERPAPPPAALPVITFADEIRFHLNGETLHVFHPGPAHTDGDAVIHFEHANVIHTGDIFFNGFYPFIDAGTGGSTSGMIAAVERILERVDDDTRIIPGHGALATRRDLEHYLLMLRTVHNSIATLMVGGNDVAACVAAKPTATFDPVWGGGFLKPDDFVRLVFDSITRETLGGDRTDVNRVR